MSLTMRQRVCGTILLVGGLLPASRGLAQAATIQVGPPEDVAPKAEATRYQKWPRAAWCEGTKCWLVAWREGDISEREADIWCARVSADGKALDPAGVRLTSAKGIQDQPVVASDGKGFLVAWSDFRNGQDWDVYAARVSGDGKALDADGVLVAGGGHNQCQPASAFAGGNYLIAWQAFVEKAMTSVSYAPGFGSYEVRGTRVSTEGKVLDAGGNVLAPATAFQPSLAEDGEGNAWLAFVNYAGTKASEYGPLHSPCVTRLDAAKCAPQGAVNIPAKCKPGQKIEAFGGGSSRTSLVCVKGGGVMMAGRGFRGGTSVFPFAKDGADAGETLRVHDFRNIELLAASSLAADGKRVLLTQDWFVPGEPRERPRLGVWGWMLSPDGKVLEGGADGFPIAVEAGKDRVQGFACAGPAGVFLVVCAEARGPDDTKVVARLLK